LGIKEGTGGFKGLSGSRLQVRIGKESPLTRKIVESLPKLRVTWIWGYLILGGIAMMNGRTSFLAAPVDHPLPFWFKALFLNVPLQMALALTASVLLRRTTDDQPNGVTVTFAFTTTLVMAVNLVTAIWFIF
jgi:branched-subunit amino acid transport protein